MQNQHTRLGLALFAIYLGFYSGFVLLAAFAPDRLAVLPLAGVNLAIWYGFALIVVALVLALIHGWTSRANDESQDGRLSENHSPGDRP
jgi:uncharacterized membrane protein (DUF485 family)